MSNKTDKELLELAAKAAGIVRGYHKFISNGKPELCYIIEKGRYSTAWNPLTDDGDAFRLAVKLKVDVIPEWGDSCVCVIGGGDHFEESQKPDEFAAMRRAIVRAAAAIGEKL